MDEVYKCCRCKERKPRQDFGGIKKRADYCKPCAYAMNKEYAKNNRDQLNANNRKCAAKRYALNRVKLTAYLLDRHCVDCGESDPIVLEFDHMDPSLKEAQIADILGSWGWPKIMNEIEKCQVRCANCHRRKTHLERGWYKKGR